MKKRHFSFGQFIFLVFLVVLVCLCIYIRHLGNTVNEYKDKYEQLLEEQNKPPQSQTISVDGLMDISALGEKIRQIGELATTEYTYRDSVAYHSQKTFFSSSVGVPLTKKGFLIRYCGTMKFGFDVSDIKVSLDTAKREIRITLPEMKLLSHEIDYNSLEVVDEQNQIFSGLSISDFSSVIAEAQAAMETWALDRGVQRQASEQAKDVILQLVSLLPGTASYSIVFS